MLLIMCKILIINNNNNSVIVIVEIIIIIIILKLIIITIIIIDDKKFCKALKNKYKQLKRVHNRLLRSRFPAHFFPLIPPSRPFSFGNPDPTHFPKTFLR